jgi:Lipid A 3-O-deacylase (PagL)
VTEYSRNIEAVRAGLPPRRHRGRELGALAPEGIASNLAIPRLILRAVVALLFANCLFGTALRAQTPPYPPGNEFGVWAGVSLNTVHVFGITSDEQIYALGFRYARTLYDKPSTSLQYTLDIVPAEIVRQFTFVPCGTPSRLGFVCPSGREVVYGGGANPIGLKMNFRRQRKLQPFIAAAGGFITSLRPVPVDISGGTQYNYTFDAEAGLELFSASRRSSWKFGYRFQHISNAYRHNFNPGLDNNQFYIGYSFFK